MRAARAFLGVPKNTTSVAILAEINWLEPVHRAQIRMVRQYFRVNDMNDKRLTNKIINWDKNFSRQFPSISTWYSEVQQIFENHNILNYFEKEGKMPSLLMENLKQSMLVKQTVDLQSKCKLMPKLRTYTKFMEFGKTPAYLLKPLSFVQKMFLAKTRLAALPLRLETGRYERPRLPEQDRLCPSCKSKQDVENEEHFVFFCNQYHFLRQKWLAELEKPPNFFELITDDKFKLIFNKPENVKITAQYIVNCFDVRSKIIFQET